MADHETFGAQEWQLPGYGKVPSARANNVSNDIVAKPAPAPAPPLQPSRGPGNSFRGRARTQNGFPIRGGSPPKPVGHSRDRRFPGTPSGLTGRGNIRSFPRGHGNRAAFVPGSNNFPRDSPAKANWRAGLRPDGVFQLPAPFGTFKHEFFGVARGTVTGGRSANKGRFEVFDDISQKTGTHVKPPAYTDNVILLWGDSSQVLAAQKLLQQLVNKCTSLQSKKPLWAKINAYSLKKEIDIFRDEQQDVVLQQLRKAPEATVRFAEKLLFLWPTEELPFKEYLGPELQGLDPIREEFDCHIYVPDGLPDYICVLAHNHGTIREAIRRIRTKWSELMASANIRSKVYLVEPPELIYAQRGIIVKQSHTLARPFLDGGIMTAFEITQWLDRAALMRSRNDVRLLNTTERAMRALPFFRGHLRMRVNIGAFILDEYRLSKDLKASYSFEEFREMLLHDQTKGRLLPGLEINQAELLGRCFKASYLLEPFETTSRSLEKPEPSYSVNFEFVGSDSALLRLEAEFERHPGAEEYEVAQRRWVKVQGNNQHGNERPPLQAAMIEFGRADWQLEIKALQFHEPANIGAALKDFSHAIGFEFDATSSGITAPPKRRVTFPPTAPVSRFVEKTALRYRLKGTNYILEIARYDEYRRTGIQFSQGQVQISNPGPILNAPFTTWGASIFGLDWDNLLGEHANMGVGHSASWSPNLKTFFPPKAKTNPTDTSSGFWEFVNLVKDVAELLGPRRPEALAKMATETIDQRTRPNRQSSPLKAETVGDVSSGRSSPVSESKESNKVLVAELGTLF
ncbi:hypothetical protein DTO280E4_4412 [Paecilomyces variotii]|nr:hypothetical protein DTO021C3_1365 [Paecilomyces variotii]KAJ9360190.1 hypothetical protein DTO280E4_4412 [Paecilomyces variotii]